MTLHNRYGVILPNTKIFGGVKRFLDLGNVFVERGIDFVVFTPDAQFPSWFDFKGRVEKREDIARWEFDIVFITEPQFLPDLLAARATHKVFYYVIRRPTMGAVIKHREVKIFVNSTTTFLRAKQKYGIEAFKAYGGVNTKLFWPKPLAEKKAGEPFVVMAYGRLGRRRKGTHLVIRACENLHKTGCNIKLLLFDSPMDETSRKKIEAFKCSCPFEFVLNHPVMDNVSLYHRADVFVSAERDGGWSNTAAEAMASGIPVIATKNGTSDFLFHNQTGLKVWRHSWFIKRAIAKLYNDKQLREKLAENGHRKISEFSWQRLADTIQKYVSETKTG